MEIVVMWLIVSIVGMGYFLFSSMPMISPEKMAFNKKGATYALVSFQWSMLVLLIVL